MDAAVMSVPPFRRFYDTWSNQQQEILGEIRNHLNATSESGQPPDQGKFKLLVDKMMDHIQVYHDRKIQAATDDTSGVAAGLWRTLLEAGFIWLGGWRPAAAVMLAYSLMGLQVELDLHKLLEGADLPTLAALSHTQLIQLNELQQGIRKSEGELSDRLAVLQMMIADQEITKAAAKDQNFSSSSSSSSPSTPTDDELGTALDSKLATLQDLLIDADHLRLETLKGMVYVLTPLQSAQYLVAAVELSVAMRRLGLARQENQSGKNGTELGVIPSVGTETKTETENVASHEQADAQIHTGAVRGSVDEMEEGLRKGGNPNEVDVTGRSAMHMAAGEGHVDCVSMLIEEGGDVNKEDRRGGTPLLDALKGGHGETAQMLMDHGGEASQKEIGAELCKAAASGDLSYLRQLVESAHCDPNTRDYDKRTPLHLAAAEGMEQAVEMLLTAGADPEAQDRHGCTPLEEAKRSRKSAVVEILENFIDSVGKQQNAQVETTENPPASVPDISEKIPKASGKEDQVVPPDLLKGGGEEGVGEEGDVKRNS